MIPHQTPSAAILYYQKHHTYYDPIIVFPCKLPPVCPPITPRPPLQSKPTPFTHPLLTFFIEITETPKMPTHPKQQGPLSPPSSPLPNSKSTLHKREASSRMGRTFPSISFELIYISCMRRSKAEESRPKPPVNPLCSTDDPLDVVNQSLLLKFLEFMSTHRNDQLRAGVKNIYGRHYAIQANPAYNFREQWETKKKTFEENNYYELIQSEKWAAYLYTLLLLLSNVALLWYLSLFRLTQLETTALAFSILGAGMVLVGVDSGVRFYLKYIKTNSGVEWREAVWTFRHEIYLGCYYFVNLALVEPTASLHCQLLYALDVAAAYLHLARAGNLFRHFRIRSYSTPLRHYFKLLDLLATLFVVEHIFTILMFLVSYYDLQNNWLLHINQQAAVGLERYYYAFYFTNTTMLTIGYGDIIPVNKLEMLCVMGIQLFGVAIFSYIISEIGYTFSSIRQTEEQLEKSISTLSKMAKFYSLEQELANLAKSHLISNQNPSNDLAPEDETAVLAQLSDDLRDTISQETCLNVVKSSLFFVCHWTKRFQTEIARRLTKKILNPDEHLVQTVGRERIFIVKSGKLQIYTNSSLGFKKTFKKLLKTIEPTSSVCDNIYGYTSIFTSRHVKLDAISKEFTSVFYIEKNSFLECVVESKLDYEYYFELKAKIEHSKFCEAFEAPNVLNIRQHYRPSEVFIIKKYVSRNRNVRNGRKLCRRANRSRITRSIGMCSNLIDDLSRRNSAFAQGMQQAVYEITNKSADIKRYSSKELIEYSKEEILNEKFEVAKEYFRYFQRNNLSKILAKLELENTQQPIDTQELDLPPLLTQQYLTCLSRVMKG